MGKRFIWINTTIPYQAYVLELAEKNGCSDGEAVLAVFNAVALISKRTKYGVTNATREEIDAAAGMAGVADALERAKLLRFGRHGAYYLDGSTRTVRRALRAWRENGEEAVE